MRVIRLVVRDGDAMAGDTDTLPGAVACVRQACPDLTEAEAQFIAGVAWGRQIDKSAGSLAAVIQEVLGPEVSIERS